MIEEAHIIFVMKGPQNIATVFIIMLVVLCSCTILQGTFQSRCKSNSIKKKKPEILSPALYYWLMKILFCFSIFH